MNNRKNQEMLKDRLNKERSELMRRREALDNQIVGIERAIALMGPQDSVEAAPDVQPIAGKRVATKAIVLQLLKDVGTIGLNALYATELAAQRGVELDRSSVSSLLSRLKKDDVITYSGDRYRLKEFTPKPSIVSMAGLRA